MFMAEYTEVDVACIFLKQISNVTKGLGYIDLQIATSLLSMTEDRRRSNLYVTTPTAAAIAPFSEKGKVKRFMDTNAMQPFHRALLCIALVYMNLFTFPFSLGFALH